MYIKHTYTCNTSVTVPLSATQEQMQALEESLFAHTGRSNTFVNTVANLESLVTSYERIDDKNFSRMYELTLYSDWNSIFSAGKTDFSPTSFEDRCQQVGWTVLAEFMGPQGFIYNPNPITGPAGDSE